MADNEAGTDDGAMPATAAQVAALSAKIDALHIYTIERIKEVRADVAGGVELHDISSNEVLSRVGELLGQVAARGSPTDVGGPGLEIESVIRLNAEAANRIMDAAEHISEHIDAEGVSPAIRNAVLEHVTVIFEACGFQDLTGQRIQRALKTLRSIEEAMLGRNICDAPPDDKVDQTFVDNVFATTDSPSIGQSDIDALFG